MNSEQMTLLVGAQNKLFVCGVQVSVLLCFQKKDITQILRTECTQSGDTWSTGRRNSYACFHRATKNVRGIQIPPSRRMIRVPLCFISKTTRARGISAVKMHYTDH